MKMKDIPGYTLKGDETQKLVLKASGNVITFVYSKASFPYTVNYLNEDAGAALRSAKTQSAVFESVITSESEVVAIDGYIYDHASVSTLTIGTDASKNVINATLS